MNGIYYCIGCLETVPANHCHDPPLYKEKEHPMTPIEKLRQFIDAEEKRGDDLRRSTKYSDGFTDGLKTAIGTLEEYDIQFPEVHTCRKGHEGYSMWVKLEKYQDLKKEHEEAIHFIEQLVSVWGRSENSEIHRQMLWHDLIDDPEITVYDRARGIIERAKGAPDDGTIASDSRSTD